MTRDVPWHCLVSIRRMVFVLLIPCVGVGCGEHLVSEVGDLSVQTSETTSDASDGSPWGDLGHDGNQEAFDAKVSAPEPTAPGITLRRLDKRAYTRTLQDLFGTQLRPGDTFPTEYAPGLFAHVAKGQSISPYMVELMGTAADQVSEDVLLAKPPESLNWHFEAESLVLPHSFPVPGFGNALHDSKPAVVYFDLPEDATVVLTARVYGQSWKGMAPILRFRVDGGTILEEKVTSEDPIIMSATEGLGAGVHSFAVQLINPAYEEELFQSQGRLVFVDWLAVQAPDVIAPSHDPRSKLMTCSPSVVGVEACGREILENYLPRAWRRPVAPTEIEPLLKMIMDAHEDGRGFDRGLKVALEASLMHPSFVFIAEADGGLSDDVVTPVTAYELASRLSYFIWGTMPDEELFEAAQTGEILTSDGRVKQVRRLLNSPRIEALVDGLTEHWLLGQKLSGHGKGWADVWFATLRESMGHELRIFIRTLLERNRPVGELLRSNTVFVDGTLAQHYGVDVVGRAFQEIDGARIGRGGLLQMAGILTTLSHPTRTSPVRRGKWVYEALLCGHVPAPPDAMEFSEMSEKLVLTAKEKLEMHLTEPECVSCHQLMDPIGLALETFDETGKKRFLDDGVPIDGVGTLPGGYVVKGPKELAEALSVDERFVECIARRFLTYALAREPLPYEQPAVDALVSDWSALGLGLADLVELIVDTPLFLTRTPVGLDQPTEEQP